VRERAQLHGGVVFDEFEEFDNHVAGDAKNRVYAQLFDGKKKVAAYCNRFTHADASNKHGLLLI
jgi:hypothetical protein